VISFSDGYGDQQLVSALLLGILPGHAGIVVFKEDQPLWHLQQSTMGVR
jgi:hypothetical protein